MPERPLRAAVLASLIDPGVSGIGERALPGHLNLRGNADDTRFTSAVAAATGMELPLVPNTTARTEALHLAWLGPDEWLLSTPPGAQQALHAALAQALAGMHAAVTDLSDAYAVIVLDCADAAEILSCDCPLDFHPRAFAVGGCAQSLVGKANALIVREAEQRFAVYVRRSFAPYVHALVRHAVLLVRAARGIPAAAPSRGTA